MQQSLQENFKTQLNDANKKIEVKRFEIKALLNYKFFSFEESNFSIISK
jgi:hypothetical protein